MSSTTTGPGILPQLAVQKSKDTVPKGDNPANYWQYITGTQYSLDATDIIPGMNLIICVDTLTLDADTTIQLYDSSQGSFTDNQNTVNGLDMIIIARQLIINNPASATYSLHLTVSGNSPAPQVASFPIAANNGVNPGDSGTNGGTGITAPTPANGGNAGNISLIIGDIVYAAGGATQSYLWLNAAGGNGQVGVNGQNGGDGIAGTNGANDEQSAEYEDSINYGSGGTNGGNAGNGGNGYAGGNGGNGGTMLFLCNKNAFAGVFDQAFTGGTGGDGGNGGVAGQPGEGGIGGQIGECYLVVAGKTPTYGFRYTGQNYPNGANGAAGQNGTAGSAGTAGMGGSFYSNIISPTTVVLPNPIRNFDKTAPYLLSSMQQQMQLSFADYLTGDTDAAVTFYNWAGSANNPWLMLSNTTITYNEFTALQNQANSLIAQLAEGLDCYGNSMNYVPIASVTAYATTVATLLNTLSNIEQTYLDYQQFLQNETIAFGSLDASFTQAQDAINNLTKVQSDLATKINTTLPAAIGNLQEHLNQQYNNLNNADQAFQNAVIAQAGDFTFAKFLDMMQNLVKVGTDVWDNCSDPNLQGGISVLNDILNPDPGYLVKAVIPVTSDFTNITNAWNGIYNPNGSPDGNAKLAILEADMDTVLQPFLDLPAAVNYITQIHDYVGIAQALNTKLLDYTNAVIQYNLITNQLNQKNAELLRIQNQEANINMPGLVAYNSFIFNQYQDYLAYCLRFLYQENKAYEYMQCKTNDFNLTGYSASGLLQFHANLQSGFVNSVNKKDDPNQALTNVPFSITNNTNDPRSAAFQSFLSTGLLSFQLDPATDNMFDDWTTVLLENYTVVVNSSCETESQVIVELNHAGNSTIYDVNNKPLYFSHDVIITQFVYYPNSSIPPQGGSFGGGENNTCEIAVSPFATMSIKVTTNPVDPEFLPNVTGIDFTFSGYATTPLSNKLKKQATKSLQTLV